MKGAPETPKRYEAPLGWQKAIYWLEFFLKITSVVGVLFAGYVAIHFQWPAQLWEHGEPRIDIHTEIVRKGPSHDTGGPTILLIDTKLKGLSKQKMGVCVFYRELHIGRLQGGGGSGIRDLTPPVSVVTNRPLSQVPIIWGETFKQLVTDKNLSETLQISEEKEFSEEHKLSPVEKVVGVLGPLYGENLAEYYWSFSVEAPLDSETIVNYKTTICLRNEDGTCQTLSAHDCRGSEGFDFVK